MKNSYKRVICRNLAGEYGKRVLWTASGKEDVRKCLEKCVEYSDGFAALLEMKPACIICNMGDIQYEFIR